MVPLARAEDKDLARGYVKFLKKHGIIGQLKASGAIGKRRETLILVAKEVFDVAYELIEASLCEAGFYCEIPGRRYYAAVNDAEEDEPNQAA